jgi:putative DNA methylase
MLKPFEWKDKPALIEHLFPVQKISAESYKEQMAGAGKTLTALGSYWKGRKPLILNKACILGSLLPVSEDRLIDLEIFELLMGMDSESMQKRLEKNLPASKKDTVGELINLPYNEQVKKAKRSEEIGDSLFSHVWAKVNKHLGTSASSFPELIEQIGVARFGRRPKVADVFCGSGQIPFEAARLGCDVYASDLNPIACMLTWGALNHVGSNSPFSLTKIIETSLHEHDSLGVEIKDNWRIRSLVYCLWTICPESGWTVPLIPSLIVSVDYRVIAELVPNNSLKRYTIRLREGVNDEDLDKARRGTVQNGSLVHSPHKNRTYRTKISTIRGDGKNGNKLRQWKINDIVWFPADIFMKNLMQFYGKKLLSE